MEFGQIMNQWKRFAPKLSELIWSRFFQHELIIDCQIEKNMKLNFKSTNWDFPRSGQKSEIDMFDGLMKQWILQNIQPHNEFMIPKFRNENRNNAGWDSYKYFGATGISIMLKIIISMSIKWLWSIQKVKTGIETLFQCSNARKSRLLWQLSILFWISSTL